MVPPRLSHAERELFEQLAAVSDFDPRRRPMTYAAGPRSARALSLETIRRSGGACTPS